MCGIAGAVGIAQALSMDVVNRMTEAQYHRGPDDSGTQRIDAITGACWLGSRRLAIIDLSPAGRMPMTDPTSGNSIVYNGEVHNFLALRRDLEAKGERFCSRTDTEVVLRLYSRHGLGCLEQLRGMFAWAIWDVARQELVLARDRAGEKPLYYVELPGAFLFASEVRALLASGLVERRIDRESLEVYLANGFLVSPGTIVRGVRSLMPGHWLRVSGIGRVVGGGCYWRPPRPARGSASPKDEAGYEDTARTLLRDAVRLRAISDVPLGVFLSGGLDSSVIAALLSQEGADVRTLSIAFSEEKFDESRFARAVASHLGTAHTEALVTHQDFVHWLPQALQALDQPSFDGLNTFCVAKVAREAGLTVALSGIGADELFGGYPFVRTAPAVNMVARLVRSSRLRPAFRAWTKRQAADAALSGYKKLADLAVDEWPAIGTVAGRRLASYEVAQLLFPSWSRAQLLACTPREAGTSQAGNGALPSALVDVVREDLAMLDPVGATSLLAWRLFLGERCLRDTDTMSMGVSLETRAPFTDHLFVEHLLRIPVSVRCRGAPSKAFEWQIFGNLLAPALPPRQKQGFTFPFALWLRRPEVAAMIRATLEDTRLLSYIGLNPQSVRLIWNGFTAQPSRIPWSRGWALYVLAQWCQCNGVSM